MNNQRLLHQNQVNIAKDISDIRQCMVSLYGKMTNPNSVSSKPDLSDSGVLPNFEKIINEETLFAFEKKIDDQKYRTDLISALVNSIGKNHRDMSHRNIALQLGQKVFAPNFWMTTAWTGGKITQEGGQKKFAFAKHLIFRSFFSDAIKQVCGSEIPDIDMAEFVKGRTKNCNYVRKTDRLPASRKRTRQGMDLEQEIEDES